MIPAVLAAAWALFAPAAAQGADYFTLALDWQPSVCARLPQIPECRRPENRWTLHGLWPDRRDDPAHDFGYCGVSQAARRADTPASWCALADLRLPPDTDAALTALMPGRASCLDRHEWLKHGSCSGVPAAAYFAQAVTLAREALAGRWASYLAGRAGKEAEASRVRALLKEDLGADAANAAGLFCRPVDGKPAFDELKLRLRSPLAAGRALRASLLAGAPREGDCPDRFLVPSRAP